MTPTQAAKEIGCSPQYLRDLIRTGKVKAKKVFDEHFTNRQTGAVGFYYWITDKEVARIKAMPGRSTRGKRRKPNAQDS